MLGMSFGNTAPQEEKRDVIGKNEEIVESLKSFGLINSESALSSEDYESLRSRADLLQKSHQVSSDVASVLAYVDRTLLLEKGNQGAEQQLFSVVGSDLIASLVSDPLLATNEEFLKTIGNTAKMKYTEGSSAFSDVLFDAIKDREAAIVKTPVIDGKIDGNDNVILPSDGEVK